MPTAMTLTALMPFALRPVICGSVIITNINAPFMMERIQKRIGHEHERETANGSSLPQFIYTKA